ncbi:MAG: VIT domain-containing protein [Phototrophicaceae bacterium]
MQKWIRMCLLWVLLAMGLPALAQDVILPTQPPIIIEPPIGGGGVFTNPDWMSVDFHRVQINIANQVASTRVEMQFTNNGNGFVEGTFLFPLPLEATVDDLVMFIDGQAIEAKILPAGEARDIYNEIVRQYRDPALLEYVGMNTLQANVFPIPSGESRRIEIAYTQVLTAENGLIKVTYPMESSATKGRSVTAMSVSVNVESADAVRNIYSPSHAIAINRTDDHRFSVGFEASQYTPDGDFTLYYGLQNESISANLLTYRESATDPGYFMLLLQPPLTVETSTVLPRDVIIVLDQSGSMEGEKWAQAQKAVVYVLEHLNPQDRFNVVAFSTGWRVFSNQVEAQSLAPEAVNWVWSLQAGGGTDINGALQTALSYVGERPATVLFMTDGLATEGEIDTNTILANVEQSATSNLNVFTFGVGDDVDTLLLDSLSGQFRGASSYVRPYESIDEEVASLYGKVSAPVLTDVTLDMGGIQTDFVYPNGQLPDLFAGEQLTIVGQYRQGATPITLTLRGQLNGESVAYVYEDLTFRERAGGEPFIARLWATRRIGELLNQIRFNGENPELVESVVTLSVRYGIITPYTSFLIEEDDILSQQGRARAEASFSQDAQTLSNQVSGAVAVEAADAIGGMNSASAPAPMLMQLATAPAGMAQSEVDGMLSIAESEATQQRAQPLQTVGEKTFILQNGVYVDTTYQPDSMTPRQVIFLSDEYFALMEAVPALSEYFALGEAVIVVVDGIAYEVTAQ